MDCEKVKVTNNELANKILSVKCNMTKEIWQMQCNTYNEAKAMWKKLYDKCNVTGNM